MKWQFTLTITALAQLSHCSREAPGFATVVSPRTVNNTSYDFIIVGGGISGLTVADRLTEDSSGEYMLSSQARSCAMGIQLTKPRS